MFKNHTKKIIEGLQKDTWDSSSEVPMGVSQWMEYGKKYRYSEFFIETIKKEERERIIKIIEEVPDIYPNFESDDFDSGLQRMKKVILEKLKK